MRSENYLCESSKSGDGEGLDSRVADIDGKIDRT